MTLLSALAGPRGTEAARILRYLCLTHGEDGVAEVFQYWLDDHKPARD